MTRSLTRNNRSVDGMKLVAVYHHGTCTVNRHLRRNGCAVVATVISYVGG
jgi:hypothetical protein